MKYFVVLLTVWLELQASQVSKLVNELNHLSVKQKTVLIETFLKAKPFKYELTMTAIAWQESKFGNYLINLEDPSCGVFHVMPRNLSKNRFKQSRLCERLIKDYDFSFSTALEQLKYWENYWKSKHVHKIWSHMIMSYNGGFRGSKKYLENIRNKIRALRIFLRNTTLQ